jgi:hypothetical protein
MSGDGRFKGGSLAGKSGTSQFLRKLSSVGADMKHPVDFVLARACLVTDSAHEHVISGQA